jgi:signal transduction histidine kinase
MYIFRKSKNDPTQMVFVADAESINPYANVDSDTSNDVDSNKDGKIEPNGADQLQWPGQPYPTPPAETFQAYDGPITNKDLYSDAYGQVLTGYAPIKDGSGNTIAVLGTDIRADDFFTVTKQTLYPFLLFIVFLVVSIVVLAGALIKLWNKRVELFAEIDRQKDELLGIIAHQLAMPVTAIKWASEELLTQDDGKLTKGQEENSKIIHSQGNELSDLISMLLDVSRIQLGRVTINSAELDLNSFFKEILDGVEVLVDQKKINFKKSMPASMPTAVLDQRYTRMIIENLLTNAIKYTPENGNVNLKVEIKDDIMYCSVKDTGCGIPKKDQDKIFGKLYRASNVQNTVNGNGFGLYVAKGAIEAQHGKIWFESEEGKGTTFFIELPLNTPTEKKKK